jgi:hypothetical protein
VREKEGRDPEPTACVIDSQSVKTAHTVPLSTQGIDAGKKIVGRKRSTAVDTLGLLLVMVTAASASDNEAGKQLLTRTAAAHPTVTRHRPTPATRTKPSNTAPNSASMSTSSPETPRSRTSPSCPDTGSSNGTWHGS